MTSDTLSDILDDAIAMLGELLATHVDLHETLLGGYGEAKKREVDALKLKLSAKKAEYEKIRDREQRKEELRKKLVQTELEKRGVLTALKDANGKTNGYMRRVGRVTYFYDSHTELVARFENGRTYDAAGVYTLRGDQGLRLLGRYDETH